MGKSKQPIITEGVEDSSKLDMILKKIGDMEKSMNFISQQFEEYRKDIEQLKRERKEEVKVRKEIIQQQKNQQALIADLTGEIEYLLLRDKASNAEVKGVPFMEGENLKEICESIAVKAGMKLTKEDISSVYRVKSKNTSLHLIKLTFKEERYCEEFITLGKKARLSLTDIKKGGNEPIYINEDLPWITRRLFSKALTYKRNRDFKFCWTK